MTMVASQVDLAAMSRCRSGRDARARRPGRSCWPDSSTRASEGDVDHHDIGAGRVARRRPSPSPSPRSRAAPSRRRSDAGPRASRRRKGSLWPRPRPGPGLGVRLGGQLDRHGPVLVVEAQEAPLVLERALSRRRGPGQLSGRAGDVGQLTHRALLGLVAQPLLGLEGWPRRPPPAPCQKTFPGTQRPDQVRDVPGLLAHVGVGPGGRRSRPRSARRSRPRGRSPRRLDRPGAGRTRPGGRESGLGGAHLCEVLGQTRRQLLVRLGCHRTDQVSTTDVSQSPRHRGKNGRASRRSVRHFRHLAAVGTFPTDRSSIL